MVQPQPITISLMNDMLDYASCLEGRLLLSCGWSNWDDFGITFSLCGHVL
jgi:hypothetical protein